MYYLVYILKPVLPGFHFFSHFTENVRTIKVKALVLARKEILSKQKRESIKNGVSGDLDIEKGDVERINSFSMH